VVVVVLQVGYVKSWSAYHTFLEQHPDKDPIPAFRQDLLRALNTQVGACSRKLLLPAILQHSWSP
jgi:hypothetical protein